MGNPKQSVELAAQKLRGDGPSMGRFVSAGLALAVVFEEDIPPELRSTLREVKARIISLRGDREELAAKLEGIAQAIDPGS